MTSRSRPLAKELARSIFHYCFDRRGNIASIFALLLVPLVGVLSLAGETSSWFMIGRAAQNAADNAALAAAANGDTSACVSNCPTWNSEALSVSSNSGFANNPTDHTWVTAVNNASCPSGGASNCYKVTVQRSVPLILTGALGYAGTSGYGGRQLIQAVSYASPYNAGTNFCMLALEPSGTGAILQNNGTMTLNGCSVQANSSSAGAFNQTNGTFTAQSIDATGTATCHTGSSCSPAPVNGASTIQDPYSTVYATNGVAALVNQPCTHSTTINANSGTTPITNGVYCANITVGNGGTLAMGAGTYIMQGLTISVNGGSVTGTGVTIILTCKTPPCTSSSANWATFTQNGGTVGTAAAPFSAPTTGSWSGILFYQDPKETVTSNAAFKMTSGAETLQGALYFPTTNVTWTDGASASPCMHIISYTMTLTSGTMNSSCAGLGVANIGQATVRAALVQ